MFFRVRRTQSGCFLFLCGDLIIITFFSGLMMLVVLNELILSLKGQDALTPAQHMSCQAWLSSTPGVPIVFLRSPRAIQLLYIDQNKQF
jgi:hypothetical protein